MSAVFAYTRFIFICFTVIGIGFTVLVTFGQQGGSLADEFDQLLGEAIQRGTGVDAARSRKEAAEIGVRKAWSRFLPSVEAYGDYGSTRNNALGRLNQNRNSYNSHSIGVSATLPIFRGGANYYGYKEAKANADVETQTYLEARQVLLLDTARAILGVIRDRKIVALERENQKIVGKILHTTKRQFEGGEATVTDIAVARDQYTAVQSVYSQAINNLRSNETEFKRLIGKKPGRLPYPKALPARLPKSLKEAIRLAERQNPLMLAALFRSEAADHALKGSYSKFLPSVDLNMDYSENKYLGETTADESDLAVKLNFRVPLFQPDVLPSTDINKRVSDQRKHEARDARLTAKAMATVAWRSYHTALKRYRLALVRIKAAEAASNGMRRELRAGQRTVLDVLDTQERLVQAKVQAANVEYERYMSAHLLLSAIGRLDVKSSNVAHIETYVKGAETKWRQRRAEVIKKKQQYAALKARQGATHIQDQGSINKGWGTRLAALGEPYLRRISSLLPALPVRKVREEKIIKLQPLKITPRNIQLNDPDTKAVPQLRNGIYSQLLPWQKKTNGDDEIVTGAIKRKPHRQAHYKRTRLQRYSDGYEIVPPLPVLSPHARRHIYIYPTARPNVIEYPDTPSNRFAVWWNGNVDAVFGAAKGPKIVLVPRD